MDRNESLLAAHEAAAILSIKPATVYDWAAKGILPHIRILAGKRRAVIRFRREDLAAFLKGKSVPAVSIRE